MTALLSATMILSLCGAAEAQEASSGGQNVLLQEVLPALAGSELGSLALGPAPAPGMSRLVRRSEILGALRAAGINPQGLAIPRTHRIRRSIQELSPEALVELSRASVAEALNPCVVDDLQIRSSARLPEGEVQVSATGRAPRRSGLANVRITFEASGRRVGISARARVSCPNAVVQPGQRVRVRVRMGAVEASVAGQARQAGRVGDVIRVQNLHSRSSLRAQVIDSSTVEYVP